MDQGTERESKRENQRERRKQTSQTLVSIVPCSLSAQPDEVRYATSGSGCRSVWPCSASLSLTAGCPSKNRGITGLWIRQCGEALRGQGMEAMKEYIGGSLVSASRKCRDMTVSAAFIHRSVCENAREQERTRKTLRLNSKYKVLIVDDVTSAALAVVSFPPPSASMACAVAVS